jgi:hypothetical protein
MGVSQIQPVERVHLDTDLLDQMCMRMGYTKAEAAITAAMEDLAILLQYCGSLLRVSELDTLATTARQIEALARRVGMPALARVANDVVGLCHADDSHALAAVVGRMRRVGERSLIAIWDRDDLIV